VPASMLTNLRSSARRALYRRTAVRLGGLVAVAAALATPAPVCRGVEMFTYFGDGSRIGLPSLEVPIEAYRGIPLRSDRLRARRAAQRKPGSTVQAGTPGMGMPREPALSMPREPALSMPREPALSMPGSMTVRTMPQLPAQAGPTAATPSVSASPRSSGGRIPVAPDPDALQHRN